jgi:hypothetical protein
MNTLNIEIAGHAAAFHPRDEISGKIAWSLEQRPRALELRLFWYSHGHGLIASKIVDTMRLESPPQNDRCVFRFKLPDSPYSFVGKLLELNWALELYVEPTGQAQRAEFHMSPTGSPVMLHK